MGGMDALMARAQADFEHGEYRWVAEVMKHADYAQPGHAPARAGRSRAGADGLPGRVIDLAQRLPAGRASTAKAHHRPRRWRPATRWCRRCPTGCCSTRGQCGSMPAGLARWPSRWPGISATAASTGAGSAVAAARGAAAGDHRGPAAAGRADQIAGHVFRPARPVCRQLPGGRRRALAGGHSRNAPNPPAGDDAHRRAPPGESRLLTPRVDADRGELQRGRPEVTPWLALIFQPVKLTSLRWYYLLLS